MSGNGHFDTLETRDPKMREREQLARCAADRVREGPRAGFARILAGVDPWTITTRAALAPVPVTRKSELLELQKADRPFGGLRRGRVGRARRHARRSPRPARSTSRRGRPDYWRLARALFAAGFRAGDLVHNCFSYHFTPAGSMLETGVRALGCTVFPGGTGQTEQQVQAMAELEPDGYVGTPSFLKIILEKADEMGVRSRASRRRSSPRSRSRRRFRDALPRAASTAIRSMRPPTSARSPTRRRRAKGSSSTKACWSRSCGPGTGDPVAPGEVGEVVVTSLYNSDYPLIRFGTGDLSAVLPGASPCGRTNLRIKGWMGRADQTTKVKGMFVHPAQVAAIVRRHPEIGEARLVVDIRRERPHDAARRSRTRRGARSMPSWRRSATSPSCAARCPARAGRACRTTAR